MPQHGRWKLLRQQHPGRRGVEGPLGGLGPGAAPKRRGGRGLLPTKHGQAGRSARTLQLLAKDRRLLRARAGRIASYWLQTGAVRWAALGGARNLREEGEAEAPVHVENAPAGVMGRQEAPAQLPLISSYSCSFSYVGLALD